jgi:stage II sporulation protein D
VTSAAALLLALAPLAAARAELSVWSAGQPGGDDRPVPIGSLLKPFVAEAWARAHPASLPPRLRCEQGCWQPKGHGLLGLDRALALSCNNYFRALAADTPGALLEATLREQGFAFASPLSAEAAIGRVTDGTGVAIRPSSLLAAYLRLVREPWALGEPVRTTVLAGLRESAEKGTASGLGGRASWAKTGTVPALDGVPLATSGWAIAGDGAGGAWLALLPRGTGREAARALGDRLGQGPVGARSANAGEAGTVRVRLLEALQARRVLARNTGPAPVSSSRGWIGPGATLALQPGDRLEPGRWELAISERGFRRRIDGALGCLGDREGQLGVVAEVTLRDYVAGVLLAELPDGLEDRRVELGAAVLRFLAQGPRHAGADVCDTTHCAWFLGAGPRLSWPGPARAVLLADSHDTSSELGDPAWSRIREVATQPGPSLWTRDCGGQPLSAHALWGGGDRSVRPCPRHQATPPHTWRRIWGRAAVQRAFGSGAESLALVERDGVWTLRAGERSFTWDEAHRALAAVLGWDALPSPAESLRRLGDGWEAEGVGAGHRVGLCLAD